jgi:hypothetical protein
MLGIGLGECGSFRGGGGQVLLERDSAVTSYFRYHASKGRIEEESNMRTTAKWLAALGIIGAAALSVPSVASAQGVYFGVPGFGVGVGAPYYYGGPYYNYYNAPYGYGYGYDYGRHWYPHRYHHYWHHY